LKNQNLCVIVYVNGNIFMLFTSDFQDRRIAGGRKMKVLLVGESWIVHSSHIKGVDSFVQSGYGIGTKWIKKALEQSGHQFEHLPAHSAIEEFPDFQRLSEFDVLLISDVGSNTLLLPPETMMLSKAAPNRLQTIKDYVLQGGGFAMIGGYMSFQGIEGKARYKGTPVEDVLPVVMRTDDDRVETPQGVVPKVSYSTHPIVSGLTDIWPLILGYNQVIPKEDSQVLVTLPTGDPLVVVGQAGAGRSMAFTTDCAPHWAPPEFLEWHGYIKFWDNAIRWLGAAKA
jgi:uncharacterized membrane protein